MSRTLLAALLLVAPLAGCENTPAGVTASAILLDKDRASIGTATLTETGDRVRVSVEITRATAGKHGLHVHAEGLCDPPDFMSAGGHFNPAGRAHGAPGAAEHHAGDFGNLEAMTIGADGRGTLQLTTDALSLRAGSASYVVGKALIFHEKEDDLTTQPTGNSGGRVGCGLLLIPG